MATALGVASDRLHVELDEKHDLKRGHGHDHDVDVKDGNVSPTETDVVHVHGAEPTLAVLMRFAAQARAREMADVSAGPGGRVDLP